MIKYPGAFLFFFILPVLLHAQDKTIPCIDLKNGIFYSYAKNSPDQYVDKREGSIVHETNLITKDTSDWQITWTDDCTYTLKYLRGNVKWNEKQIDFVKNHTLVYLITKTTADYYVFKFYADKISTISISSDTMWLNQKLFITSNNLYKRIANNTILKKDHFSDTSKYAVVYIYRPGKISNGLANYPVYLNDDIICIAQNNSGYIFKIYKQGVFEFKSKLFKDESFVKLDLKWGNTYYVKSMIHWTISSRLYNFKLETAIVDASRGQQEFDDVNLR